MLFYSFQYFWFYWLQLEKLARDIIQKYKVLIILRFLLGSSWNISYWVLHEIFYIWVYMKYFLLGSSWNIFFWGLHEIFSIGVYMKYFLLGSSWNIFFWDLHEIFSIGIFMKYFLLGSTWNIFYWVLKNLFWRWDCAVNERKRGRSLSK